MMSIGNAWGVCMVKAQRILPAVMVAMMASGFSHSSDASTRTLVLGPDVAEIVAALGESDSVIGRDDTVDWPTELAELPSLGYLRQLSGESVLSLSPQRVIAAHAAGPREVLALIEASGIELIHFDEASHLDNLDERIATIAKAYDKPLEGQMLIDEMDARHQRAASLPPLSDLRVMFILHHGSTTPMVAGRGTLAQQLIEMLGATNAFAEMQGYRPISAEGLVPAAPDVVVLPEAGLTALGGPDRLWQLPGLALTPAGKAHHYVTIDSSALLGMGLRTADALVELHGELAALNDDDSP
ncbi:heme/hemin ABC transporter substrate-binding protein [Halomonas huangheensis]|uniref:Fe/B12 periplasmic-binding domain-containing protein n=1 Tax=Halomonas huangheensis TaxID=1178482 RepID=W1N7C9_9GAMM|nr:ABC transporter substrate-binding protein [Halomonas huangheensis]ALM54191.1 hypothetical protein AR456_19390 [Halomonas huangheensis]ERL51101.1 hypothetical protein BJB45_19210 [Halomonas huangheensis]